MEPHAQPAWLIDFGNSRLKIARTDRPPAPILTIARHSVGDQQALDLAAQVADTLPRSDRLVAALGRPGDEALLQPLLRQLTPEPHLQPIEADGKLPFRIRYTSGRPGADRICNAAAIRQRAPHAWAVAIDFGTATHLTLVDPAGDLVGGSILPGADLQALALHHHTAGRLPLLKPGEIHQPPPPIGRSTDGAILSGVLLGNAGAVQFLLSQYETEIGAPLGCILATGGAGALIAPLLTAAPIQFLPDLTMEGLSCLAEHSA